MSVIETLRFRTAPGVAEPTFLAADRDVQRRFVPNRPGFFRRTTARAADGGEWIVVTLWEDEAAADAAVTDEASHPDAIAFAALLDVASVRRARYLTLD
jgi:hypothetical protein